jgi:hypothetical protein
VHNWRDDLSMKKPHCLSDVHSYSEDVLSREGSLFVINQLVEIAIGHKLTNNTPRFRTKTDQLHNVRMIQTTGRQGKLEVRMQEREGRRKQAKTS